MTEDEAKTKTCCGSPIIAISAAVQWSGATTLNLCCIASGCMAWRVEVVPAQQENAYNTKEMPEGDGWKPHSPSKTNVAWWRQIPEERIGFCGLAGRP